VKNLSSALEPERFFVVLLLSVLPLRMIRIAKFLFTPERVTDPLPTLYIA